MTDAVVKATDRHEEGGSTRPKKAHGSFRAGSYAISPNYGQIAFATAIIAWIVWYYFDALAASPNVQNMLLIRPATLAALVLYALVIWQSLRISRVELVADESVADASEAEGTSPREGFRAPAIAALLCLYVAVLPYVGFDIGTFLFVASSMAVAGERRIWVLILFPAAFAVLMALAFRFALSTPVPTILFGGGS